MNAIKIEFELLPVESAILMRFLRGVSPIDVERTLGGAEDAKIFEAASEKLRLALRERSKH